MSTGSYDPAWQRYARSGYRSVSGWLTGLAVVEFVQLLLQQDRMGVRGPVCEVGAHLGQSLSRLSRNELVITETELKLIAAAARIGLNSSPKNG